jgi:TolA-binding protein
VALATATVIGCGWGGTEESLRFNSYQTEREMGRLPPLPTLSNGKTDARKNWGRDGGDAPDDEIDSKRVEEIDALWDKAEAAEQSGDLQLTRTLLRDYLARTIIGRDAYWFGATMRQERRNSAIDRLDAMTALDDGARLQAVRAYLAARRAYDNPQADVNAAANQSNAGTVEKPDAAEKTGADEGGGQTLERALAAVPTDAGLRDNVAYLRAAASYSEEDYPRAASAFTKLARQYASSEKREAALYMAALSLMKSSESFTGTSGDEAHLRASRRESVPSDAGRTTDEAAPTPIAACCDDAWRAAHAAFARFLDAYPRGRYTADARGWLAYLLLRANDRAGALVEYYRLLGDQRDRNARIEATVSLTFVRHHATDDEMRRVEAELEDEPQAALAYAYHNIFNYAIDPGCEAQWDYPENQWEADLQQENKEALQRAELRAIVAFASRLMQRYPRAGINGQFAVRVAGANLELGENRLAAEQAGRALALNVQGEERARALWLKSVAQYRLRDYAGAKLALSSLLAENPQGEFAVGARRQLAMLAEDTGDVDGALEQYLSLGYDKDVAYFIDVLMSPEQLAHFIEGHPDAARLDELRYALGLRYMRERRWTEARAALARVRTVGGSRDVWSYESNSDCYSPPGFEYRCHDPKDTDTGPGVTARLLLSDIKTIDDLERLEQKAERAEGDEAKAEALYQLASYEYESSTLLFYNPIAWHGMRHYDLAYLHRANRYHSPDEAERLWQETQQHEPIARALVIYLDIARRFPKTRAARDALYTAAVAHERLSSYNEYWGGIYGLGLHAGDRLVTYADVRAIYPAYQLPRGTFYWEPVTRTVMGGPGWAAPPPPIPRLTRRERLRLFCEIFRDWLKRFWTERLRHPLTIVLTILGALFASCLAARARKLLRTHLGRRRVQRRSLLRRWLAAARAGQLKYVAGDEAHALLRAFLHQALRLLLHPRGRLMLALNLLAHALLIALLVSLVETLYPG